MRNFRIILNNEIVETLGRIAAINNTGIEQLIQAIVSNWVRTYKNE